MDSSEESPSSAFGVSCAMIESTSSDGAVFLASTLVSAVNVAMSFAGPSTSIGEPESRDVAGPSVAVLSTTLLPRVVVSRVFPTSDPESLALCSLSSSSRCSSAGEERWGGSASR